MEIFKKFKQGLFTKSQFVTGVTLTMLGTSVVVYSAIQLFTGLKIFTPNTVIKSSEINQNFELIDKMMAHTNQQFSLISNVTHSVPTNTFVTLDFDQVYYDYTIGSIGTQFKNFNSATITEEGIYDVTLSGQFNSGWAYVGLAINNTSGSSVYLGPNTIGVSSFKVHLEPNDTIKIRAWNPHYSQTLTLQPGKTRLIMRKL